MKVYVFRKNTQNSRHLNGSIQPDEWHRVPLGPGPPHPTTSVSQARAQHLSLALENEQLANLLLLVDVILLQQFFVQPVGVFDARYGVLHLHEGGTRHSSDGELGPRSGACGFKPHGGLLLRS